MQMGGEQEEDRESLQLELNFYADRASKDSNSVNFWLAARAVRHRSGFELVFSSGSGGLVSLSHTTQRRL